MRVVWVAGCIAGCFGAACIDLFDTPVHETGDGGRPESDGSVGAGRPMNDAGVGLDGGRPDSGGGVEPPVIVPPLTVSPVTAPAPHVFAGANHHRIYVQHNLPDQDGIAANTRAQIQAMRQAGLHVLRIFLHQENRVPGALPSATYTFEGPMGTYHEASLELIDRMMPDLVGDPTDPFDDVRLIVTLFNRWEGTPSGDVDERLYFGAFGEVGFYTDPRAREAFKARMTHVLNHRNPYLMDKAWKDIDLIIGWEPMNEPGVHTRGDQEQTTTAIIADWLGDVARHIKSVDRDGTLVVSGTGGGSRYDGYDVGDHVPSLIEAGGVNGIPGVDVYSLHFYGGDLDRRLSEARAALPPGKRVWITEFGGRRAGTEPLMYENAPGGILGRLNAARVSWLFWRLGVRRDGNSFARFTWDVDWVAVRSAASGLTQVITDFENGPYGRWSRNDGEPVVTRREADKSGFSLAWAMDDGFEELVFNLEQNYVLKGRAITFRARSTGPLNIEVQLRDDRGGSTRNIRVPPLGVGWRFFQIPVEDFVLETFEPSKFRRIVFWAKEGSSDESVLWLDDFRIW